MKSLILLIVLFIVSMICLAASLHVFLNLKTYDTSELIFLFISSCVGAIGCIFSIYQFKEDYL